MTDRILAEIDAETHRDRLARLYADGATLTDALILWDTMGNAREMVKHVPDSSFDEETNYAERDAEYLASRLDDVDWINVEGVDRDEITRIQHRLRGR